MIIFKDIKDLLVEKARAPPPMDLDDDDNVDQESVLMKISDADKADR